MMHERDCATYTRGCLTLVRDYVYMLCILLYGSKKYGIKEKDEAGRS